MKVHTVVFTMKGCPHCDHIKNLLKEQNISFHNRDIDEYEEEYEDFKKVTNSDYVPALLIIEEDGEDYRSYPYVPDEDFIEIEDAVKIIKEHNSKVM
jgi:glutaredoxin